VLISAFFEIFLRVKKHISQCSGTADAYIHADRTYEHISIYVHVHALNAGVQIIQTHTDELHVHTCIHTCIYLR
jgi:hypothetical protein